MSNENNDDKSKNAVQSENAGAERFSRRDMAALMFGGLGASLLAGCGPGAGPGGMPNPGEDLLAQARALSGSSVSWADSIGTVASPGDLRALSGTSTGAVAVAVGFWAKGDGGGGIFYWDNASMAADDGGTIIRPTAIGTGDPGRWKREIKDGVYSVRYFGAKGDNSTADDTAFTDALAAMPSAIGAPFGKTLLIPPGIFKLTQPFVVNKSVRIVGTCGFNGFNESILRFYGSCSAGLVIDCALDTFNPLVLPRADGTIVDGIRVEATQKTSGAHGVVMRGRSQLRNLYIYNWGGNGIHIVATAVATEEIKTNSNLWMVYNCQCILNGGHGLYTQNDDANAGLCMMLDAQANGGWAVREESFLGNTYIACHADSNYGAYYCTSSNVNLSTFIGCYAESTHTAKSDFGNAFVMGGVHGNGYVRGCTWAHQGSRMWYQGADPSVADTATMLFVKNTGQTKPHLSATGNNASIVFQVEADGGVWVGPMGDNLTQGPQTGVGGSWTGQLRLAAKNSGDAGIRWILGGGLIGWVATARAFVSGVNYVDSRLTFQTPNATGGELDTLTLRQGRVGVATTTPSASAALEVGGNTAGFLPPRLTTTERNAIASPAQGLMVFNTTTSAVNVYDGSSWRELAYV